MDLRFHGPEADAAERAAVDSVLGPPASAWMGGPRDIEQEGHGSLVGGHAARSRRDLLLPALHAVQSRFGWVPPGALDYICRRLMVPPAEAHGVVTFYHLFSLSPRPLAVAHVCDDIACRIKGAESICADLEHRLGPESEGCWRRSPCLGLCERAPAALVLNGGESPDAVTLAPGGRGRHRGGAGFDRVGVSSVGWVKPTECQGLTPVGFTHPTISVPQSGSPSLRLLQRIGQVDPESLEAYRASGGYSALARAIEIGPAGVIREVLASKLMGRGGAAFPTGRKWEAVARAADAPPLRGLQCRRVGARHVQGSRPDGGRSVRRAGGDDDRRLRDRERARVSLHARGVSPRGPPDGRGDRRGPGGRLARRGYPGAGFSFDVELRRGAARISAARRRHSSTRSRASAASRGTSPPSPCRPGCSASRRSSTTSRRW